MRTTTPSSSSFMLPILGVLLLLVTGAALLGVASAESVTIAAAGDIACSPDDPHFNDGHGDARHCQMSATSDLILQHDVQAVLALGDLQYSVGEVAAFQSSFAKSWGRFKDILFPVPGNHDYDTADGAGYYAYLGDRAGDPARGYDSFDLGDWHVVALNSNCSEVGGCDAGSKQVRWLEADLESHPSTCLLAYWHHPRFSSGMHGSRKVYQDFWDVLDRAGADVVLAGHEHDYERFAPQSPSGDLDAAGGARAFVVGTGGVALRPIGDPQPNSEMFASEFGVLFLDLGPLKYEWSFVTPAGDTLDSGKGRCGPELGGS